MLVHEHVHVVCVSVKQVGKLQLYSLFLVKGGCLYCWMESKNSEGPHSEHEGEGQHLKDG